MVYMKVKLKIILLNMKVNLLKINMKEMENIFMKMVIIIQVNGRMETSMEKEQNIIKMVILNMKVMEIAIIVQ